MVMGELARGAVGVPSAAGNWVVVQPRLTPWARGLVRWPEAMRWAFMRQNEKAVMAGRRTRLRGRRALSRHWMIAPRRS